MGRGPVVSPRGSLALGVPARQTSWGDRGGPPKRREKLAEGEEGSPRSGAAEARARGAGGWAGGTGSGRAIGGWGRAQARLDSPWPERPARPAGGPPGAVEGQLAGGSVRKSRAPSWPPAPNESQVGPHLARLAAPRGFDQR